VKNFWISTDARPSLVGNTNLVAAGFSLRKKLRQGLKGVLKNPLVRAGIGFFPAEGGESW